MNLELDELNQSSIKKRQSRYGRRDSDKIPSDNKKDESIFDQESNFDSFDEI